MYHIWGLHEVRDENTLLTRYYRGDRAGQRTMGGFIQLPGQFAAFRRGYAQRRTRGSGSKRSSNGVYGLPIRPRSVDLAGGSEPAAWRLSWRLDAFLRVLDLNVVDTVFLSWEVLERMAGTHTAKVLHCLEKMVADVAPPGFDFHLGWESAANIIRTAMRSTDPAILQRAGLIREGLLQKGRSEFLEVSA